MKHYDDAIAREHFDVDALNVKAQLTPAQLVDQCEARYTQKLDQLAAYICAEKIKLVLLTGPSGSGKTTSSRRLMQLLKARGEHGIAVTMDDFYRGRDEAPRHPDGQEDLESVEVLDIPRLRSFFTDILQTGESVIPQFDFEKGRRSEKTVHLKAGPDDVVICEGIHALNPRITDDELLGAYRHDVMKVYLSVRSSFYEEGGILLKKRDVRFLRRGVRDFYFRGTSLAETFKLWPYVCLGEDSNIRPFARLADVIVDTTFAYEPCVMKSHAIPLLQEIAPESPYYAKAQELIQRLNAFAGIDPQLVPDDSILREFIGGRNR